jgi:hypothetical protein
VYRKTQVTGALTDKNTKENYTMALDDLDLEFEDEDEAKKKKNDVLHQDVDLEFQMQDTGVTPRPTRPAPPAARQPSAPQQPMGQVKNISDARTAAAQPARRPIGPTGAAPQRAAEATALKSSSRPVMEGHYDLESEEIVQLRERALKAEFDADVKVQVAEFKTDLLSELLGDMKLMDHQVNQLLVRINAKHPDMKQEVLMIKKILADFTSKKRK